MIFFPYPVSHPPHLHLPLTLLRFGMYCACCGGILISLTWSVANGVCCALLVTFMEKEVGRFFFPLLKVRDGWYLSVKKKKNSLFFSAVGLFSSFYYCYSGLHFRISSIKAQFLWSYFSLSQCLGGRVPPLTEN